MARPVLFDSAIFDPDIFDAGSRIYGDLSDEEVDAIRNRRRRRGDPGRDYDFTLITGRLR